MSPPSPLVALYDRSRTSAARAKQLCSQSELLADVTVHTRRRSLRVRHESIQAREQPFAPAPAPPATGSFVVEGYVDGTPVTATWDAVGGLRCPPVLLHRARLVVAMAETFGGQDGEALVPADLAGGRTAALLTTMRALTQVTAVELTD